jgi:hypothetical protein
MGTVESDFQDVDKVLGLFDVHRQRARRQYAEFVGKGVSAGRKPELVGGGLIRSVGGWHELRGLRGMKIHFKSDERILGDSDFVETVLNFASEAMERRYRLKASGYSFKSVAERVGEIFDMPNRDVMAPGKQPDRVKARSVLAYWAVHELGMSVTEVGMKLGLSQSATSRAVQRGRGITEDSRLNPEIARNA